MVVNEVINKEGGKAVETLLTTEPFQKRLCAEYRKQMNTTNNCVNVNNLQHWRSISIWNRTLHCNDPHFIVWVQLV